MKKCLNEKSEWYEKNMNAQNQLKPFENPTVLASQIMSTKKVCESHSTFINCSDYLFGVMNILILYAFVVLHFMILEYFSKCTSNRLNNWH